MPPIVVDAGAVVSRGDVLDSRPGQDVVEGSNVVDLLRAASSPKVLISSGPYWRDEQLSALRPGDWVTTTGSGYETFPVERFAERNVAFTNMPGNNAPQVAEHAIGMVLTFTRKLWTHRTNQRERTWTKLSTGTTHLAGKRCCVVGMGHIGEAVARRLQAFEMRVHGVKRSVEGYSGHADEIFRPSALHEALRDADLLVLCVPLTDETRHLIGAAELDLLDDDAILVNVGRGPTLESAAVVDALDADTIGAACLDVTDPEPLPSESPLWAYENVLVTSHSAAKTESRAAQFLDEFLDLFDRWAADGTLPDSNRVV